MKFLNPTLVILGILFCFGQSFAINHYKHFEAGIWQAQSQVSYLKSKTNFNTSGKISDLPNSNYFQIIDITSGVKYGISDDFNAFGNFNVGIAESNSTDATRSNSTLNKILVGGEYLLGNSFPQFILEFYGLFDLEKVDNGQDNVMNSEAANELTGKLNLQFDFSSFYIFGYGGYSYRDKGRSNLFPWGLNAEWAFDGTTLGGEIFGFQSITDDKDKGAANEVVRDALRSRVNGGSAKYYTTNPSVIDSNLYLKIGFGRDFMIWIAGGIPLVGNNYSNGPHVESGLRWTFGSGSLKRNHKREVSIPVSETSRLSTDKKVETFKEDTNDGVDQRIFKATPTTPPRQAPIAKPVYAPAPEELKEKMDDVEMKIELRSNKKKKKKHL